MKIVLQPKQWKLYDLLVATGRQVATTIGFGGAKGGGKSAGVDECAILLAGELGNKYPGLKITIIRRVYNDLKSNHIDRILTTHPELLAGYTKDEGVTFANGARIIFAYAETEGDVERKFRGGYESAFIFVDEAQQFTERELLDIKMAARWTRADGGLPAGFCKLVLLFNPGGKSSEYLRRIFWTRNYHANEEANSFAFMHVFGWDNYEWFRGQVDIDENDFYHMESDDRFQMFITQTSEGRKYNAFPAPIRAGFLLGNFDHFEGQYFAGVWDAQICVLPPELCARIIQPWWTRWMAQDWGFGDHDAHGWFASGKLSPSQWMEYFGGHVEYPMDVAILYREQVVSQRAEMDLAMDIVAKTPEVERQQMRRFFLSQDAFGQKAKQGGAHTVGEQFSNVMRRFQMPLPEPADQDRVNGWRFMYNCLRQANLRGQNVPAERTREGPAFFVSAECPVTIEGIPMATRDPDDVEDVVRVEGALWEDVTDMVRYGLKSQLRPKTKAPLDVRAKELYHSIQGDDGDAMTRRAMAMAEFKVKENRITRVQRMPRWR